MDVKIPKGMRSPTVIIVGSQEPDNKMNEMHGRRMDLLEKKMDAQYRAFINKEDTASKSIDALQRSFSMVLDKYMRMNQSMMSSLHKDKIDVLRKEFSGKIKSLEENNNSSELEKTFASMLGNIEKAISNIKPIKVTQNRGVSSDNLSKSFDLFYEKMQKLVSSVRPRMIPYVS